MSDQAPCPICKATLTAAEKEIDSLNIDCPHCGNFSLSGTAISTLPSLIGKDRQKVVLLGHELRKMQANGTRPLLTSDVAQRIVDTGKLPSVATQADNLVRWLGDHSPAGKLVAISVEQHGAIIGMTDLAGFHLILNGLKDRGLIRWHGTYGSKQNLHLTYPGIGRYEELRATPQQPPSNHGEVRHRHAAVLCTDIASFSNLMGSDEVTTLANRSACESLIRKTVQAHRGRFVKSTGDGTLSEFGSAIEAIQAALEVLRVLSHQNAARSLEMPIELRVGLAVGDVVDEDGDIFGGTVNIAARLQAEAAPGTICTPEHVRDDLENKIELVTEELGQRTLKGIKRPVRVVLVRPH